MHPLRVVALMLVAAVDALLLWWGMLGTAFCLALSALLVLSSEGE